MPAAQFVGQPPRAVRRIIVHDQDVEAARLFADETDDPFQVFNLIVRGDYDDRLHDEIRGMVPGTCPMVSAETVSRVRGFSLQSHSAVVAGVVGGYDLQN